MQQRTTSTKGITSINGPVSFHLFRSANGKVSFYLFGDVHYSESKGCDSAKRISMNEYSTDLTRESIDTKNADVIDIDAAIYLTLLHNNKINKKTELYMEHPIDLVVSDVSKTTIEGWLSKAFKLLRSQSKFSPNCSIKPIDIRQTKKGKEMDIMTLLSVSISDILNIFEEIDYLTESQMRNLQQIFTDLLNVSRIVLANHKEIFGAITDVGKTKNLNNVIDAIYRSVRRSELRSECIESLESMKHHSSIKVDEMEVFGHTIAINFARMKKTGPNLGSIADKLINWFSRKYSDVKEELDKSGALTEITEYVLQFTHDDEAIQLVMKSLLRNLSKSFIQLGAYYMDMYTMSTAFLGPAEKMIFAGEAHISTYVEILRDCFGYNHLINETNFIEFYDEETNKTEGEYVRCVTNNDIPKYLDFNAMKDYLYK